MKIPKIRIRKDGKPYKNDIEKGRAFVKENFAELKSFEGENLPKSLKGYFNIIDSSKERAKNRFHNPETGRFFNKKENKAIETALKSFAKDTGRNYEDLRTKKDIIDLVYKAEIENVYINQVPSDKVGDMVKDKGIKKVVIVDQNGNKKTVTPEKAILMIYRANRKANDAMGGKGFSPVNKTTLTDLKSTLEVFVPNFRGMNDEQIIDLIEQLKEDGDYELKTS